MVAMATGVPQPSTRWGGNDPLTQTAPVRPSANEESGWYYIDPTDPNATDTNNTYGYPAVPRLTMPLTATGARLPAGTVIEIAADTPIGIPQHSIWADGSADNPVWLRGLGETLPRVGSGIYPKGAYITIENLDLGEETILSGRIASGGIESRAHDGSNLHHIVIRGCVGVGTGVADAAQSVLGTYGTDGNRHHDVIFYDNNFECYGDYALGTENDYHCFTAGAYVDWVWIINNTSKQMGGDSCQIGATFADESNIRPTYVFIGNNDFSEDGENAIDIKESKYVVASENYLHHYDANIGTIGGTICVVHYNEAESVWFLNNKMHTGSVGLAVSAGAFNVRAIGNTLENIRRPAADDPDPETGYNTSGFGFVARDGTDMLVANNTFHQNDRPINLQTGSGFRIWNNIFSERNDAVEFDIYSLVSASRESFTLKHNIINGTNTFHARWGIDYTDVTLIPEDEGSSEEDPLLDLTSNPTRLQTQAGSPAIDNGTSLTSYFNEYFAIFGVSISGDRWGYQRVQGTGIDTGAFESGGVFVGAVPGAPTGLLVDVLTERLEWTLNSVNEDNVNVLKNDIEILSLGQGIESVIISGISSSEDTYKVEAENETGKSSSAVISSSIIGVSEIVGDLEEALPLDKSYKLVRVCANSELGLAIANPVNTGTVYSLSNSRTDFTESAVSIGDGYVYVLGELGNGIVGTFTGTGSVDIITADINISDTETRSEFVVDSSVVRLINNKSFRQNRISVSFTDNLSYAYVPTTDEAESAIAISALIQTA